MRVSLVASSNGLGHARRLLNLISGFKNRVNSLSLLLSINQARLLKSEIQSIQKEIDFTVIESKIFGLDAFHSIL